MYFCFKYIDGSGYQNAMLKFGLSQKRTIWKKQFPHGFDKSADLLSNRQNHEKKLRFKDEICQI